jgi:hypothetical protein
MSLKSTQLCHMDSVNRAEGKFSVTVHSEDGNVQATFACSSERAAHALRNAIREHADKLHHAANYRERGANRTDDTVN